MSSEPDAPTGLGQFAEIANGPMVVVTAAAADELSGCLVGFHTQCSIDPERYVVGLSKTNHTYEVALRSDILAVNLLGSDQLSLAELFGGLTLDEGVEKFDHCRWTAGDDGVPLLDDAAAWIVGEVNERLDVGDHVLHILRPRRCRVSGNGRTPLRFTDTESIEAGHPA